jgi:drug/metabolite transporter (DMT)-like permease
VTESVLQHNLDQKRHSDTGILLSFLIIIGVAATAASAHILLKIGMNEVGEINAENIKSPGRLIGQFLTTPAILAAIPIYAISNVGWVVVLSRLNLSVAYPFLASLYIFIPILSMLFLSESLSTQHWTGIVVIGIGVGIVLGAGLA